MLADEKALGYSMMTPNANKFVIKHQASPWHVFLSNNVQHVVGWVYELF